MRFSINHKGQALTFVLSLLLIAGFWTGCGQEAMTSSPGPITYSGDNPPPFLTASGSAGITFVADDSDEWYCVAKAEIEDDGGIVAGSRYQLYFPEDALDDDEVITVFEHDPSVLDVQFGPHGVQFDRAVRLRIDYSGTNADPESDNYDGSTPAFFWFDDVNNQWVRLEGKSDTSRTFYFVYLSHFSRYAVAAIPPGDGTADW